MTPPLVDVEVVGLFAVREENGRDYLGKEPIIALYVQLYLNAIKSHPLRAYQACRKAFM